MMRLQLLAQPLPLLLRMLSLAGLLLLRLHRRCHMAICSAVSLALLAAVHTSLTTTPRHKPLQRTGTVHTKAVASTSYSNMPIYSAHSYCTRARVATRS